MLLARLADRHGQKQLAAGLALAVAAGFAALLTAGPARWRRRGARLRLALLPGRDAVTRRVGEVLPHAHHGLSLESVVKAMEFRPRPTDVFILTPPKTGTTWMQALCHSIRTRGLHTDFEDIYQVAPWDQLAWDLDQNLDGEQVAEPRLFKTHLPLSAVSRPAKYICVMRDVEPTLLSWYNFLLEKKEPPAKSAGCASEFVLRRPGYVADGMQFGPNLWGYYAEFAACLDLPNVLVVTYEDLVADLEGHLDLLAGHLGLPALDADAKARVVAQCSRQGMMADASKYDESWSYEQLLRVGRSPDNACAWQPASRVKEAGSSKEALNEEARAFIARKWQEELLPKTGLHDYSQLRGRVVQELKRRRQSVS